MSKERLHLDKNILYRIQKICKWRDTTNGRRNHSAEFIISDLSKFVSSTLKEKLIGRNEKSVIGLETYARNKKLYERLASFEIKRTTFQNLFNGKGASKINCGDVEVIIDYYLKEYESVLPEEKKPNDDQMSIVDVVIGNSQFIERRPEQVLSIEVIKTVILQSAGFCNFRDCSIATIAQSEKASDKITSIGKVCMIYGDKPGTPRYDKNVSVDFYGPANCILMCANHALKINENNGDNYTASELLKWKKITSDFIRSLNEGKAKIQITGLYFNAQSRQVAESLLTRVSNFDIFSLSNSIEGIPHITNGVKELRGLFLQYLDNVAFPDYISKQLSGALYLSNAFIEALNADPDPYTISLAFSTFKKIFGSVLLEVSEKYKLQLPYPLSLLNKIASEENN